MPFGCLFFSGAFDVCLMTSLYESIRITRLRSYLKLRGHDSFFSQYLMRFKKVHVYCHFPLRLDYKIVQGRVLKWNVCLSDVMKNGEKRLVLFGFMGVCVCVGIYDCV